MAVILPLCLAPVRLHLDTLSHLQLPGKEKCNHTVASPVKDRQAGAHKEWLRELRLFSLRRNGLEGSFCCLQLWIMNTQKRQRRRFRLEGGDAAVTSWNTGKSKLIEGKIRVSSQILEHVAQRGRGNYILGYTHRLTIQGAEHPAVLDLAWAGGETRGPFQPMQCCDYHIHRSVLL